MLLVLFLKLFCCILKNTKNTVDIFRHMRYYKRVAERQRHKNIEAWLSLVERYIRDVEVAGSNPVASIFFVQNPETALFSDFSFILARFTGFFSCVTILR